MEIPYRDYLVVKLPCIVLCTLNYFISLSRYLTVKPGKHYLNEIKDTFTFSWGNYFFGLANMEEFFSCYWNSLYSKETAHLFLFSCDAKSIKIGQTSSVAISELFIKAANLKKDRGCSSVINATQHLLFTPVRGKIRWLRNVRADFQVLSNHNFETWLPLEYFFPKQNIISSSTRRFSPRH